MKELLVGATCVLSFAVVTPLWAAGSTWRDHAFPFTFRFGNHIDSHQQSKLARNGDLRGFLYITYTGEVTPDGYPVARHCDESTPPKACVVGWIMVAKPGQATFLYHNMDHPVWLVNRTAIPQPGAYAHFHWITSQSSDHRPVLDPACNATTAMELLPGAVCPGYFLELVAIDAFAFEHEGQRIRVDPGLDIATHVNIVASAPMTCGNGGC
jgi:hypothetical protein